MNNLEVLKKFLVWAKDRLDEPSTYAGIALILVAKFGLNINADTLSTMFADVGKHIPELIGGIVGLVAIFKKDPSKKN